MMRESYPKEIKTTRMAKAKENVLNVEIQTISSGSVQNYQETTIKEPSSEDHGVIVTKTMKKRLKMKNVLWLMHPMRLEKVRKSMKNVKYVKTLGAICRTEVCTEVCASAIYPNKVVSEPGYNKQRQKTKTSREYTNYLLSAEDIYTGAKGTTEGRNHNRNKSKSWKIGEIKDKEVNMTARDSHDTLVCCLEITVEDCIMDSGASFHATYCKEELERFKLRSGKYKLDSKDVRYILGLKRMLISVGKLDEEGYHIGFRDQQWKVTKGSLVVARRNKHGSLFGMSMLASKGNITDVRKVDIYFCKRGGLGKQKNLSFIMSVKTRKLQSRSCDRYNANLQVKCLKFDNGGEYSRAESTGLCAEAPKMLWADSVSTTYLIYRIPYIPIGLRIPEEEWRGKDTSLAHLKAATQMKCDTAFGIRRVTRLSEAEILHLWTRFMEPENDSIVAEHGLSSKITQSPGGSSDTSEGSENSGSFEDSGRSDEEYSEDGASSKEGGSETPQRMVNQSYSEALSSKESVQWKKAINEEMVSLEKNQTCSLVRISAGKKASQRLWMFKVKEEQNGRKRYKARLVVKGFQQKRGVDYNEIFSPVVKMTTIRVLIFVEDSCNEEPCSDVHQVGDEREVEVLDSFNWPSSELITEDGVLPERGGAYHVVQIQWDRWSVTLEQVVCGCHSVRTGQELYTVQRIESARATLKAHLPYGMFLTHLFRHVMEHYPYLDNGIYNAVDRVMHPLALKQTWKPRSDRGKARHSVSSTSAHHNCGSSSHQGDDDEDDGASRISTPSPTTYLNSLKPLDYQQYDIPTSSKQNDDLLFERQTDLLNQT
ncbi:retrovirus-related pol polyprotein from transposon TNT 1-94 [Tanacetum coccineum]